MFKKEILFSVWILFITIGVARMFGSQSCGIPDPEVHTRFVFELLKKNDTEGFAALIIPKDKIRTVLSAEFRRNRKETGFLERMLEFELFERLLTDEYSKGDFKKTYLDQFNEILKETGNLKNAEILNTEWKLTRYIEPFSMYRCNAKIYFRNGSKDYKLKYKNFFYMDQKWYAGNLTEVELLDADDTEWGNYEDSGLFPDYFNLNSDVVNFIEFQERVPDEEALPLKKYLETDRMNMDFDSESEKTKENSDEE